MTTDSPRISVIVPVYNTKLRYLKECFKSIATQTFKDYEVILVDDGSEKEVADFLDRYAKSLRSWVVVHQHNSGVSVARNVGIDMAKGDYIFFLDADDMFRKDFFQVMYAEAERSESDVVTCWFDYYDDKTGRTIYFENTNKLLTARIKDKSNFHWEQAPEIIFNVAAPNPWTKLIRKDFLKKNKLYFNERLYRAQDLEFSDRVLICAKKVSILDKNLILYRFNTGVSNTDKRTYPLASYQALLSVKSFLDRRKVFDSVRKSFSEQASSVVWFHLRDTDKAFVDNYVEIKNFLSELDQEVIENSEDCSTKLMLMSNSPIEYYQKKITLMHAKQDAAERDMKRVMEGNSRLEKELASHLGVKRSMRLTVGNIIRRSKRALKP